MTGRYLVAEEYRRLLFGFAAELVPGSTPRGGEGDDTGADPLQSRPLSCIAECVDRLLRLPSDIPIEWRVAEHISKHTCELLTARALSSPDIGGGVDVLHRHQHVLTNARTISHRSHHDGRVVAVHQVEEIDDPTLRFLFHSLTAAKLHKIFEIYDASQRQHRIDLRAPSLGALMQRFDRELDFIDIGFHDREITLGLSRSLVRHRLGDREDRLIKALDRELTRKSAEIPTAMSWTDRVKFYIRANQLADVSIDQVCNSFRLQRRTLGRLLRNEGTNFTAILGELRRERAVRLVGDTVVPLKRVAAELGFNSDASFSMAFKSWTGETPMRFRKAGRGWHQANDDMPANRPTKAANVVPLSDHRRRGAAIYLTRGTEISQ